MVLAASTFALAAAVVLHMLRARHIGGFVESRVFHLWDG